MAIAFRDLSGWWAPVTTGAVAPGLPAAAVDGDVLLFAVCSSSTAGFPTHSLSTAGWAQASTAVTTGTSGGRSRTTVYWARKTAGLAAPSCSVGGTGVTSCHTGIILAYSGCVAAGTPFEATPTSFSNFFAGATITRGATAAGRAHVVFASFASDTPTGLTEDYPPDIYTTRSADVDSATGPGIYAGARDFFPVDDNDSVSFSFTLGGTASSCTVVSVVLIPASSTTHEISGTVRSTWSTVGAPQNNWTLKAAAATRGIHFGQGWGPPPWSDSEVLGTNEYNSYALPGMMGSIWTGPGSYNWASPDFGKSWADAHPGTYYASTQLFYGIFGGPGNNTFVPAWLRGTDSAGAYGAPTVTPAQLTTHMQNFLTAYMQRYPNMSRIEICNELATNISGPDFYYTNSSIGLAGGKTKAQYVDQLARWALAIDPNAEVFYNDQGGENGGTGLWYQWYQPFYDFVVALRALGTPLKGLGFQCHSDISGPPNFATVRNVIAQYKAWGFHIHITEVGWKAPVDVNTIVSPANQAIQADYYRKLIEAFLLGVGGPGWLKSITTWGTRDRPDGFDLGGMIFDINSQRKLAWNAVVAELIEPWAKNIVGTLSSGWSVSGNLTKIHNLQGLVSSTWEPHGNPLVNTTKLISGTVGSAWGLSGNPGRGTAVLQLSGVVSFGWGTTGEGPRNGPRPKKPRPWRIWRR